MPGQTPGPRLREKPGDSRFVAALRAIMFDKGVSRRELDEQAFGGSCVNNWLHGIRAPRIDNFEAALNALGYELQIVERPLDTGKRGN